MGNYHTCVEGDARGNCDAVTKGDTASLSESKVLIHIIMDVEEMPGLMKP